MRQIFRRNSPAGVVDEYLAEIGRYRHAPNPSGHFPYVVKALALDAGGHLEQALLGSEVARCLTRPLAPQLPQSTSGFYEIDGWEEVKSARGRVPYHFRYRKIPSRRADPTHKGLPPEDAVRGAALGARLWGHIWKTQLGVKSSDEFWECLEKQRLVDGRRRFSYCSADRPASARFAAALPAFVPPSCPG